MADVPKVINHHLINFDINDIANEMERSGRPVDPASFLAEQVGAPSLTQLRLIDNTPFANAVRTQVIPWYNNVVVKGGYSNLVLFSDTQDGFVGRGVGKTFIATAIFYAMGSYSRGKTSRHLSWRPRGWFWLNAGDFLEFMGENSGSQLYEALSPEFTKIVVVDDLSPATIGRLKYVGAAQQVSTFQAHLLSLVNWCWQNHIPLVFTANVQSQAAFEQLVGTSTASRLDNTTYVHINQTPDFRPVETALGS